MSMRLPPLSAVLDLLPDAVCMVDPDGHFLFVNAVFETIFGYAPAEALGMQMLELVHPDDRAATKRAVRDIMQGRPQPNFRNRYVRKDGRVVDVQWSARWLPEYGVRIAVGHEVTALRGVERDLEYQASHDPLTGLPNRYRLRQALDRAIVDAVEGRTGLAVLYLDLDGFKAVNDRYGHDIGDSLLCEVAGRFRQRLRHEDLVARIGGDEFVAVLPGCRMPAAAEEAIAALQCSLQELVIERVGAIRVGVSIGTAFFPDDGNSAEALLRHADMAMYAAKLGRRRDRRGALLAGGV